MLDENRALKARARSGPRSTSTGTGFLLRKKQEVQAVHHLRLGAAAEGNRLFQRLARQADDARRQTPAQSGAGLRVLLDASFLVRTGRAATFRTATAKLGRQLAGSGYHLTLSGPWPPYTFVAEPT
jgi:hypothetical protein